MDMGLFVINGSRGHRDITTDTTTNRGDIMSTPEYKSIRKLKDFADEVEDYVNKLLSRVDDLEYDNHNLLDMVDDLNYQVRTLEEEIVQLRLERLN